MEGNHNIYDIIFINTELKKMDGKQLGKCIRKKYWVDVVAIVYVSSKISKIVQLLEVMPSGFIQKPFKQKELYNVLNNVISAIEKHKLKVFSFRVAGVTYKVPLHEILYFESRNKVIDVYTITEKKSFYSTLCGIEAELESQEFLHIHKSYLVNGRHIIQYSYDKVTLTNHVELPISQTRRKKIKSMLTQ